MQSFKSKNMFNFSESVSQFPLSSYFGMMKNNQFEGMGTIFIDSNNIHKIVTKFKNGLPFGEYTYYATNGNI